MPQSRAQSTPHQADQESALNRASDLNLLKQLHQSKHRLQQLENVLHLNRETWISSHQQLPPNDGIYWVSDGHHVWLSTYNTHKQRFETSIEKAAPNYWSEILKPSAPLKNA